MIGSAKITYTNENVCELVRKDLVDKFGNRELANYNLYLPGVIRPKAVISEYPTPTVTITSVEDQIKAMGIYPKQSVPRANDTVEAKTIGVGATLISKFDAKQRKLVITGGPVTYSDLDYGYGHWYFIFIGFPLGVTINDGDIISFTLNGDPMSHTITAEDVDSDGFECLVDAKYTTADFVIHWDSAHCPEKISCVCNASLAETAIDKIPEFPTEPKVDFEFPQTVAESVVQVDVDLDLGKE